MNQLDWRMTIDSGGRLMPWAREDALAVPWTIFELDRFFLVSEGWRPAGPMGSALVDDHLLELHQAALDALGEHIQVG